MRYISLFSGIEAASVAWGLLGFHPVAFAEIEPFPCAVLAHRFPDVPNLGDVTTVDWSDYEGRADIVVGGSPCQAFSISGLRLSLADDRGNLTLHYVRIVHAVKPRFAVWENVPGVLSTKDNAFGCFLAGMVGADAPLVSPQKRGRWGNAGLADGPLGRAAWRILDAQYFGVPQRRQRVFLIFCPRDGADPAEILFERHGLQRHPSPQRKTREEVTGCLTGGSGSRGWNSSADAAAAGFFLPLKSDEVARCLLAKSNQCLDPTMETYVTTKGGAIPFDLQQITCPTNRSRAAAGMPSPAVTRNSDICITSPVAFGAQASSAQSMNPSAICPTLDKSKTPAIAYAIKHDKEPKFSTGRTGALQASDGGSGIISVAAEMERTFEANLFEEKKTVQGIQVRRLLPVETERLQDFPDDWTLVPYRGKAASECPDGPRYKSTGNSMCCSVMEWIGQRIQQSSTILTSGEGIPA